MEAALRLVRHEGLGALTVRSVAEALGVTSPAIYHYVSGKDELVERVCELVTRQVPLGTDTDMAWDDRIVELVVAMHRTFAAYPGVGVRALSIAGPAPAAAAITEHVVRIVEGAGYSRSDALQLATAVHLLFSGWLLGRPPFVALGGHETPLEHEIGAQGRRAGNSESDRQRQQPPGDRCRSGTETRIGDDGTPGGERVGGVDGVSGGEQAAWDDGGSAYLGDADQGDGDSVAGIGAPPSFTEELMEICLRFVLAGFADRTARGQCGSRPTGETEAVTSRSSPACQGEPQHRHRSSRIGDVHQTVREEP